MQLCSKWNALCPHVYTLSQSVIIINTDNAVQCPLIVVIVVPPHILQVQTNEGPLSNYKAYDMHNFINLNNNIVAHRLTV